MPTCVAPIMPKSTALLRRAAASAPTGMAISVRERERNQRKRQGYASPARRRARTLRWNRCSCAQIALQQSRLPRRRSVRGRPIEAELSPQRRDACRAARSCRASPRRDRLEALPLRGKRWRLRPPASRQGPDSRRRMKIRHDERPWQAIVTMSGPPARARIPNAGERSSASLVHATSVRSLTGIGALSHRPLSLAFHTPLLGSRKRKTLTASSASICCALP